MVSFAFLAVMAFSAVPSPLYGLYRARDHFSLFMVTVIYAVYAFGVIGALLLAGHLSDWYGRRRLLLPALGLAIVSAIVFLVSKSLAGLLVGRLLNGIAIGIVVSTATAYLTELDAVGRPEATCAKGAAHRVGNPGGRHRGRPAARGDPRPVGGAPPHGAVSGAPRGAPARHARRRCVARDPRGPETAPALPPATRLGAARRAQPVLRGSTERLHGLRHARSLHRPGRRCSWPSRCITRLTRSREPSCLPCTRRPLPRRS